MTDGYREATFSAQDGLRLYYRDYGDPQSPLTPVLCLSGLTRNSKDFHVLASRLAGKRRVLAPDYRGRGRSAYDPDYRNYQPRSYLMDIGHLLTVTGCHKVVVIGTSLGGILAMAMGAAQPTALRGVVLNDIGPEIDPAGLNRIGGYVGKPTTLADLEAGARAERQLFAHAYPDFGEQDWLAAAERAYRRNPDGSLSLNYDPKLAKALAEQAATPLNLWPLFGSLAKVPTLAIRGALSDILSQDTFERMAAAKPDLIRVTVANRGHVPLLTETDCVSAIDDFLTSLDDAEP